MLKKSWYGSSTQNVEEMESMETGASISHSVVVEPTPSTSMGALLKL